MKLHPDNDKLRMLADGSIAFDCPGCKMLHRFIPDTVPGPGPRWRVQSYNPLTISPSLLVTGGADDIRCHSFIRDGNIQFLGDCTHGLKGQTVPMVYLDL